MSEYSSIRDVLYGRAWIEEVESTLKESDPASSVPETSRVLEVIIETGLKPYLTMTVAGFANGNARLIYNDNGGVFGDLFEFPEIAESAKELVKAGQAVREQLPIETEIGPLPPVDHVRFVIITATERRADTVPGPQVVAQDHLLFQLFVCCNQLWTRLSDLQDRSKQK